MVPCSASTPMQEAAKSTDGFPDPTVDYRTHPEAYRIGHGERGVLTVQPYKSELLPLWHFKTPAEAESSSQLLYKAFEQYKQAQDFVGMDMARKFLQMGYTRSRRYARHRSGRKYAPDGSELPVELDEEKQRSAEIFQLILTKVRNDEVYQALKRKHQQQVASSRKSARSG